MRIPIPALLLSFLVISPLRGQTGNVASQTLSLEVKPVSTLSVSGSPAPFIISSIEAGVGELKAEDRSTRYAITSNRNNMKLAVSIDAPMPAGTKLLVSMLSSKGLSRGPVDISRAAGPVDAVTGIGRGSDSEQEIVYTLIADASVGPVPPQSRVITLTLTD
ncbi:MAG: hypothetical protein A3H45_08025 [Ignavibacteria bacterium RIFCSPLOWO2_02_FULL_55_14]|nr:MAG: hypothetical protein A3H45_08025 [Ignavibacteria bacterium RIFCSPLOWO2_02_FULL_55_14]OGU71481.1 MAG: hypothetical protein A3G43_02455 [Ignavibacteria bacterium RIFCSPLOWO2_12_FULL_56_21]